ncbi:hypothetical protein [Candidatus Similichlamydia epinepheli]|uniref:hypothetical protein n=1 Tax=Candidatus Similichlamydia epinepheli TaxID=1903953 RepID=UPI000D33EC44|nr:hypothetical protein [Candidatus Similichlamydia epinepheli]
MDIIERLHRFTTWPNRVSVGIRKRFDEPADKMAKCAYLIAKTFNFIGLSRICTRASCSSTQSWVRFCLSGAGVLGVVAASIECTSFLILPDIFILEDVKHRVFCKADHMKSVFELCDLSCLENAMIFSRHFAGAVIFSGISVLICLSYHLISQANWLRLTRFLLATFLFVVAFCMEELWTGWLDFKASLFSLFLSIAIQFFI